MKIRHITGLVLLTFSTISISTHADLVTDWNSTALNAIRVNKTPPPMAARNLAILHAAIFDACNSIGQNCEPYFVTDKAAGVASKPAAINAAAHGVLVKLFPSRQTIFDEA